VITAHVAGLPVEEVLPALVGGSAWLVLKVAVLGGRRRSR
jgi:hypothetical protein